MASDMPAHPPFGVPGGAPEYEPGQADPAAPDVQPEMPDAQPFEPDGSPNEMPGGQSGPFPHQHK
jgi:hypothetical protein